MFRWRKMSSELGCQWGRGNMVYKFGVNFSERVKRCKGEGVFVERGQF